MSRKRYPSDLTDEQWAVLGPMVPDAKPGGRPRKYPMRDILDALFYVNREGCRWRALPHDFPPWKTVYNYFAAWEQDGTWQALLTALRMRARRAAGRDPDPSGGCADSQSVKTAHGGEAVGTDGGKKVRGRKRHIATDTLGLLLAVVVTAANVDDGVAARDLFAEMPGRDFPRLRVVYADGKYHNHQLAAWLKRHRRPYRVEVVSRPQGARGFEPLPVRWVAERTFAWLGHSRRLSKDYERTTASSQAMVRISAIHHMLRRLKPTASCHEFRYKRPERNRVA